MNSPDTTYEMFEVSMIEDVKPDPGYLEQLMTTAAAAQNDEIQDQSWERTDKSDWSDEALNILVTQVNELTPQLGTVFGLKTKQEMWSLISTIMCNAGHMYTSKQVQNKFYYLERYHKIPGLSKGREKYIQPHEIEPAELVETQLEHQSAAHMDVFCKVDDTLDWSEQESEDSHNSDTLQNSGKSGRAEKRLWSRAPTEIMLKRMKELLPQVGTTSKLKTKKKIYDIISKELCQAGYMYTCMQVDTKFASMERRYRKRIRLNSFDHYWAYESDVAELLGERPRKQTRLERSVSKTAITQEKNPYIAKTSQQRQQHRDQSIQMAVEHSNGRNPYATKDRTTGGTPPNFQEVFLPLQEQHATSKSKDNSVRSNQEGSQESNVAIPTANNHVNPSYIKNQKEILTTAKEKDNFISTNVEDAAACTGTCGSRCITAAKVVKKTLKRKMAMLSKKYAELAKTNKEFEDRVLNYLEQKEERAKRKEQRVEREEARKKRKLELLEKLVDKFCN